MEPGLAGADCINGGGQIAEHVVRQHRWRPAGEDGRTIIGHNADRQSLTVVASVSGMSSCRSGIYVLYDIELHLHVCISWQVI